MGPIPARPAGYAGKKQKNMSLRILCRRHISEWKRAFASASSFPPFRISDPLSPSVLTVDGMMMLPRWVCVTPFKLIFFVLVERRSRVAASWLQATGNSGLDEVCSGAKDNQTNS